VCVDDYCRSNQPISLKLGFMIEPTSGRNRVTFWWWFSPRYGFWITLPFSWPLQNRGILGDLLAFLIPTLPLIKKLVEMIDADKKMNPLHFGSGWQIPGSYQSENLDWNPGYFWRRLDALMEVCCLWMWSSWQWNDLYFIFSARWLIDRCYFLYIICIFCVFCSYSI